ncbi:hypothetical protein O181_081468 [Austropuccinia psidii MF-1]|uniref:Uncharacterized protein n=1 Tax=Austropuccinia psidii MF-1 TaxID=1389203 RepID=A0A9Q3FPW7_9BASI|nr:hypothetical protein [Austropuccinia psidii MF-1]
MSNSKRFKSHSEGSDIHLHDPVQTVLHSIQRQRLEKAATYSSRSDELLGHPQKAPEGESSEILQWMEFIVIKASNEEYKALEHQKEGGKQGRSPSSFYQKETRKPTSPRGEEDKEKELEEAISPHLPYPKNPKI